MLYFVLAFFILALLLGSFLQYSSNWNHKTFYQSPVFPLHIAFLYVLYGGLGVPIYHNLFANYPISFLLFWILYLSFALGLGLFAHYIHTHIPKTVTGCMTKAASLMHTCFSPFEKISHPLCYTHDTQHSQNTQLTEAVFSFEKLIVREVMIPKLDIFAISEESLIKDVLPKLIEEGFSRVPVYKKTIDHITGILLVKDLLKYFSEDKMNIPVSTIVKTPFFTPEIKTAASLLQEFRQTHRHLAVVVNEYGFTEGIVTMEDIMEEIFGEILDEYDSQEDIPYKKVGNSWVVDGRMNISTAEELFNLKIDHEHSYDTLGGHVFHKVGVVPKKGLKLHYENFDIEIITCSERSIGKLKITPIQTNNSDSDTTSLNK